MNMIIYRTIVLSIVFLVFVGMNSKPIKPTPSTVSTLQTKDHKKRMEQILTMFLKAKTDYVKAYGKQPTCVYLGTDTEQFLKMYSQSSLMFRQDTAGFETFNGLEVLIVRNREKYLKVG